MDKLEEMLKKLYGLYPYNTLSNISYGDAYLVQSIETHYSKEEIDECKKKLGIND